MEVIDEFANIYVESDDEEDRELMNEVKMQMNFEFSEYMVGNKIIQIKINFMPKTLMPLEKVF
jgi:hypothetical protein